MFGFGIPANAMDSYFADWEGDMECRMDSKELYLPPILDDPKQKKDFPLCHSRHAQLQAMSHGGRFGFDQPYIPEGSSITVCISAS